MASADKSSSTQDRSQGERGGESGKGGRGKGGVLGKGQEGQFRKIMFFETARDDFQLERTAENLLNLK